MRHLLIFATFASLFTACHKKEGKTIAFIAGAATDFWTIAEAGCKKADRELNDINVVFKYTSDGAIEEQKRILDDLMVTGIEGVVIAPLDPTNQKLMIDNVSAKIPTIVTDSDIPGSKRLCYIGTSNIEAGKTAGKLIKEAIPDGGDIMLFVGKADAQNAKERIEGIRAELNGTNIKILDVLTDNIDRVRAKANVNDALVRFPAIKCLVGLWSYNGPAILNAVHDAGKLNTVKIVCFDEEQETLKGVEDGSIVGTIVQQPFEFGYKSIQIMAAYMKEKEKALPPNNELIIPVQVIRKQDAAKYISRMDSLRHQ